MGCVTSNHYNRLLEPRSLLCDMCGIKLGLLVNRKKLCCKCGHNFCDPCLPPKPGGRPRTCSRCKVLDMTTPDRGDLLGLRVRDLQQFLLRTRVDIKSCLEKKDLVELVLQQKGVASMIPEPKYSDQTIRVSGAPSGQGESGEFPQGYVESSRRQEWFQEKFGLHTDAVENIANADVTDTEEHSVDITEQSANICTAANSDDNATDNHLADMHTVKHSPDTDKKITRRKESENPYGAEPVEVSDLDRIGVQNDNFDMDVDADILFVIVEDSKGESEQETTEKEVEKILTETNMNIDSIEDIPDVADSQRTDTEEGLPGPTENGISAFATGLIINTPTGHGSRSPSPSRFAGQDLVQLSEIESVEDLGKLSIMQVKKLLAFNRVNFRGCIEKEELSKILLRLWEQEQRHKDLQETMGDETICKICMDSPIDCVMLDCGHMATCITCGKQMTECPICRQYVVRVVKTFNA